MTESRTLARILSREREAILRGDFPDLERIGPLKESLLQKMRDATAKPSELQALSDALAHNQSLLAAAINGIKDVNDRIDALRVSAEGFTAYGQGGQTSHIGPGRKGFERKA